MHPQRPEIESLRRGRLARPQSSERNLPIHPRRKDREAMSAPIYPRSPREMMDGWVYLPRFIDKIRLHLAGKLPPDYEENFTKGFDGAWLRAAGVSAEQMIDVVKNSISD